MKFGLDDKAIENMQKVFEDNWKIDSVVIFGSRAKGNYREDSDIDLAVKGRDISFAEILTLNVRLQELDLPSEIDLVNYAAIKDEDVIEHIDRVGIVFYKQWREYKLKDVTIKIGSGSTPTGGGNSYKRKGISLIRSQNILDFNFAYEGLAFIDDEQADALKNVIVKENDVLLNITGDSVARVCKVPKRALPARVNQHVSIIRAYDKMLSSDYLLYHLHSIKDFLLSISEIGGTRNALTKSMIENITVVIPPLQLQNSIACILSSIDDKIDLLQRQNKTLEQLAETLFRQWFVEEASEDWEVGKVGDVLKLIYGKALKENVRTGAGFPVIGSSGIIGYHSKYIVKGPGIVIGRKGTLGKVIYVFENFFPIDTTYYVEPKVDSAGLFYEYFLLKILNLEDLNSDSAVPGLNRAIALSKEVTIAPFQKKFEYNEHCSGMYEKIKFNLIQIQILIQLRDVMLPKVMSGEVRVKMD